MGEHDPFFLPTPFLADISNYKVITKKLNRILSVRQPRPRGPHRRRPRRHPAAPGGAGQERGGGAGARGQEGQAHGGRLKGGHGAAHRNEGEVQRKIKVAEGLLWLLRT